MQCSEICGFYHGFMPISIQSQSLHEYLSWLNSLSLLVILKEKLVKGLKSLFSFLFFVIFR